MATKRALWNKVGRYFSALVIAVFFLPFFGVSCDGMDVVTVSGADMVGGCKPGGLITQMDDESERRGKKHHIDADEGAGGVEMKVDNVEREPLAIVALVLAIGLFGAAWIKKATGPKASFGAAIALLGVLVALYIKVGGELKDAIAKEAKSTESSMMTKDSKVSSGGRYGLWLEVILLGSILYITGRAMREAEDAPPLPAAQVVPPPNT